MRPTARISRVHLSVLISVTQVSAFGIMKSAISIRPVKTRVMKPTAVMKLVPKSVVFIAHLGNVFITVMSVTDMKIAEMGVMRLHIAKYTVLIASTSAMIVNVSHQTGFVMDSKIVTMAEMRTTAKTLRGNVIRMNLNVHMTTPVYLHGMSVITS